MDSVTPGLGNLTCTSLHWLLLPPWRMLLPGLHCRVSMATGLEGGQGKDKEKYSRRWCSLVSHVALSPQLVIISSTKWNNKRMTNDWKMRVPCWSNTAGQRILAKGSGESYFIASMSTAAICLSHQIHRAFSRLLQWKEKNSNPYLPLKALINAPKSP